MTDTTLIYPYEFEGGKKAIASEVNANFEAVKTFANGINATIADLQTAIADLKNKPTREMLDIYYSFSSQTPAGAYPLWTGETITHCKSLYPQFWNKVKNLAAMGNLVTVTEEEYEEKLEEYGQCAAFYLDELNGHLRLPKVTRFISSIADLTELAKVENSANTAHTHNVKVSSDGSKNGYDTATGYLARGYTKYSSPWSSNNNNGENKVLLTSEGEEEGRPKNVKLCLYIQVANNLGELSELNTNAIAEELEAALVSLQSAYQTYSADLEQTYQAIKNDIIIASPVIKDYDIEVSTSMFVADSTYAEYPYKVDIPYEDADEDLIPEVNFALEQIESGNYAPVALSGNGYVRIYAKEVPEMELVIPSIVLQ